jgi:hypothetical protein
MAERIEHRLIDDLDGSEIPEGGGERIDFTVRGVTYRIDLSSTNAEHFDKVLAPFVRVAARIRTVPSHHATLPEGVRQSTVRTWARKHGYDVAARGRLRADVLEAFEAAH